MFVSDISLQEYINQIMFVSDISLQEYINQMIRTGMFYLQKAVEQYNFALYIGLQSGFIVQFQTELTSRDIQLHVAFDRQSFFALNTC